MTVFLGLTGSIGMGKSTTAAMFRHAGIPVHDSDAVVHALYEGEACDAIEAAFPGTVMNGAVNRAELGKHVLGDADAMKTLEAIVHPLVRRKEIEFRKGVEGNLEKLAVLDVPLLFETGGDSRVDGVIVVTAPKDVQKTRVLQRPGMNENKFSAIVSKQTPDEEKRRRANFIIDTSLGKDHAKRAVSSIIDRVLSGQWAPSGQPKDEI
ncbi:MAG: dephospho-CoA kinase [Pseudomonadota bacterium]